MRKNVFFFLEKLLFWRTLPFFFLWEGGFFTDSHRVAHLLARRALCSVDDIVDSWIIICKQIKKKNCCELTGYWKIVHTLTHNS
jgi:hypothetical protein